MSNMGFLPLLLVMQKQGFLREGAPQLTPNQLSRKIGHPSCEKPNEAPEDKRLNFWENKPWYLNEYTRLLGMSILHKWGFVDSQSHSIVLTLRHVLSAKVFQKHSKLLQNLFKEIEFQSREICILICNFSSMLIYESLKGSTMFTYFYHQVDGPSNT